MPRVQQELLVLHRVFLILLMYILKHFRFYFQEILFRLKAMVSCLVEFSILQVVQQSLLPMLVGMLLVILYQLL